MSTSDKADRLAAKLRENLRRRKAQARDVAHSLIQDAVDEVVEAHLARWLGGKEEFLKV